MAVPYEGYRVLGLVTLVRSKPRPWTAPPNKRMQRTKRHVALGRRALRAVVADLRFAADPQRSADDRTPSAPTMAAAMILSALFLASASAASPEQPAPQVARPATPEDLESLRQMAAAAERNCGCEQANSCEALPALRTRSRKGWLLVKEGSSTKPVAGAAIRLVRWKGSMAHIRETRTDRDGGFSFNDLPPGRYHLTTCMRGLNTLELNLHVARLARSSPIRLLTDPEETP
jgi:hypothetical protein